MANQETLNELFEVVQKQIEAGTFNLEAVQRIADLRSKAMCLEEDNRVLNKDNAEYKGRLEALREDLSNLRNRVGDIEKREAAVKAAEIQIAVDKKELEMTKAFKGDLMNVLNTALRSPIVQTVRNEHVPVSGGQNSPGWTQQVTTTEMRQEV